MTALPRRILVAGFGKLGAALAQLLTDAGHSVTGLKRQPAQQTPNKVQMIQADLTDPPSLVAINQTFDEVFYILTPNDRSADAYRQAYEIGLVHLMARLTQLGSLPHWTFVSSTSVYGQNAGEWVDETSPTEPKSETAQALLEAEQALRRASPKHTIVRFAGIYGPGRTALLNSVERGVPVQVSPPAYTNRIHQRDAVQILAFLMGQRIKGVALESVYLACDDDPVAKRELADWLADQIGCPRPPALPVSETAGQNKRCSNARLKALGYQWRYPDFRAGYAALLAESATR